MKFEDLLEFSLIGDPEDRTSSIISDESKEKVDEENGQKSEISGELRRKKDDEENPD